MPDKHISSQFDAELNTISTHVLEMGGLVEAQLHQAVARNFPDSHATFLNHSDDGGTTVSLSLQAR